MNNITSIEFFTPDFDPKGTQIQINFANGWGASIIKHQYSSGYYNGLWELAIIKDNELNYVNPLTDDILGYLTDTEVGQHLETIASWE